jgi:hypothetical protein
MADKLYLIRWNAGYGSKYDLVSCDNEDAASTWAYDEWREDIDNIADYSAVLATPELCKDHGLDWPT